MGVCCILLRMRVRGEGGISVCSSVSPRGTGFTIIIRSNSVLFFRFSFCFSSRFIKRIILSFSHEYTHKNRRPRFNIVQWYVLEFRLCCVNFTAAVLKYIHIYLVRFGFSINKNVHRTYNVK